MKNTKETQLRFIVYGLYSLLVVWSLQDPFFWDTIQLASKHAHFYFSNNLELAFLPDEYNSGHIPAFGYYLACIWIIFGKTLLSSHLAVLPFVFLFVESAFHLLTERKGQHSLLYYLPFFFDPTWIAQITLVSPDIVLVAGLFTMLAGIASSSKLRLYLGSLLLVLVSIRGIVCFGVLGLLYLYETKDLFKTTKVLLPAILLVILYYALHFYSKDWVGVHAASPWKQSISFISFSDVFRNSGLMFWRLFDFGRVIWLIPLLFFIYTFKKVVFLRETIVFLIAFALLTLPFVGLTAHRYYLPVIMLGLLTFCAYLANAHISNSLRRVILSLVLLGQLAGHFLQYPRFVAQGWDSSLRYKPYHELVKNMEYYIDDNTIDCDRVGSVFPLKGKRSFRTLEDNQCEYASLDLSENDYVIYSNIMNDFSESDYKQLEETWSVGFQQRKRGIEVVVFEKPRKNDR